MTEARFETNSAEETQALGRRLGAIVEGAPGRVAYVAGRGEPLSFAVEGWEHLR